jgi:hypothetical protein
MEKLWCNLEAHRCINGSICVVLGNTSIKLCKCMR